MLRLVLLLSICDAIVGSNDTLNNEIPTSAEEDLKEETNSDKRIENQGLEEVFKDAVHAYLEEDWDRCIEGFNEALHGYKLYKRMVTNCRGKCRAEAAGSAPFFAENIEDLHFYEKKVKETLCLLNCNKEYRHIAGSKSTNRLSRGTEQKFIDQRVYEYLHICYHQRNRNQDAASALFTFLVRHPRHEPSIETLKYYLTLPDVKEDIIVNLETPPFVALYFNGVSAYDYEDYKEAVGFFESSLRSYLDSEEECRFYCEGPFDQGWHPEFTSSIANHFAYGLKCKRTCSLLLNHINGDNMRDLLRSHYNYLQFSYYKLGNLKAACAAVESFLLFAPADPEMLHNKEYYAAQPKVSKEYFAPREEALSYVKRQEYEVRLLRFISQEFKAIDAKFQLTSNETESQTAESKRETELGKEANKKMNFHPPPGHSPASLTRLTNNLSMIDEEREIGKGYDRARPTVMADVDLIANEKELFGRNRYVADGFLNSSECQSLMQLALDAAIEGDGYDQNKSPHSSFEKFEGITVGRAALMAYFGQIEAKQLDLLLESTEAARAHVERYFKLDRHLYFTYTHLVCRTALPDSPPDRDELSHEIHADNCQLIEDQNICSKESPAYVWRDYSAIVYLNDDFEGGEFFFAKHRKSREAQSTITPTCGRMVAFSAGEENLHGVRGVVKGRRCALALWFTMDERYLEYERVLAQAILKRIHSSGPNLRKAFRIPSRYEDILIQYFQEDEGLKQQLKSSL